MTEKVKSASYTSMLKEKTIFLDFQSSTPLHKKAVEMMAPYVTEKFANPHSNDHVLGWESQQAVQSARRKIANAVGADDDEIIFTSGATEANNLAVKGLERFLRSRGKIKIITSSIEHKCVLASLEFLKEGGFDIVCLQPSNDGIILPEILQSAMDDTVGLVSIMLVNNEIGTIQPISELCTIAHQGDALFHTDAAQASVFMNIDVNQLDVDLLSLSSHKIYGPKGIGALFIRRDIKRNITPIIHGWGQEDGLRSGTLPTGLCVGFGEALYQTSRATEANAKKLEMLSSLFLTELKKAIPEIEVNGSLENRHPGNLNIRFPNFKSQDFLQSLQPKIAASTGSACNSGIEAPSYVLDAIGLAPNVAAESIRFSFGVNQAPEEIMEAVKIIHTVYRSRDALKNDNPQQL